MVVIVMLLVTENMLCIRKCTRSKSFTQFMLLSIVIAVMADRSFIVSVNVPAAFQNAKLSSPVACATPLRFAAQQCSIPRHIWRASGGGCRLLQKTNKEKEAKRREEREAGGKAKTGAPVEPQVPRMPVPRGTVATATKSPASRDPSVRTRKQSGSPGAPLPKCTTPQFVAQRCPHHHAGIGGFEHMLANQRNSGASIREFTISICLRGHRP